MGWHRHDLRRVAATSNVGGEPIVTIDFQLAVRRTIDAVALYVANAAIARIQFGYLDATTPVLGDLVHTFALAAIATPTTEARWVRARKRLEVSKLDAHRFRFDCEHHIRRAASFACG